MLWALAVVTAFLTATYMFRLLYLAFFGERRYGDDHAPEPTTPAPITVMATAGPSARRAAGDGDRARRAGDRVRRRPATSAFRTRSSTAAIASRRFSSRASRRLRGPEGRPQARRPALPGPMKHEAHSGGSSSG